MKLTDNEIRDINRYLEEVRLLPEKYRFLLFEDKREVRWLRMEKDWNLEIRKNLDRVYLV